MNEKDIEDIDRVTDRICSAIKSALSVENAEAIEHCFGPYREPQSLAVGIHRVADALEKIAEAIEGMGS